MNDTPQSSPPTTAPPRRGRVFAAPAPNFEVQRKTTEAAFARHGHAFANRNQLHQFYRYIFTPFDGAWAFKPNSKTGVTSTLDFLFHFEFGVGVTTRHTADSALTPDMVPHRLAQARVFALLTEREKLVDAAAALERMLRITSVRHPADRAVSGFLYLCRSHDAATEFFSNERLRLSALVGFDWARDTCTADGFLRYLDWIDAEEEMGGALSNSHFRPQHRNIRPGIFRPDLIGRTEDLPGFFRAIAERLDRPLPATALDAAPRNRQTGIDRAPLRDGPGARARIRDVFATDFETFGYDP